MPGRECLTFVADVRDDDGRRRRRDAPRSTRFGRIDVLFNNAGICAYGLAHELTEDAWDAMIDINLKGAVDRRPPRDPAHDRRRARRDRQQLLDRRACAGWAGCRTTPPPSGA